MALFIRIFVLLCLSGLLAQPSEQSDDEGTWDSQYPADYYKDGYKAVNEYLISKVDSSAPISANMDVLFERVGSNYVEKREKIVARKLTGLKVLEGRCDQLSYEALKDNDLGTDNKSYDVTSRKSAPRRIDKIVNYYGKQHAISCQKRTESLFKPLMKLFDRQALKSLSTWIEPLIDRYLADFEPPKGVEIGDDFSRKVFYGLIKTTIKERPIIFDVVHAYNTIKTLVQENPDDEKFLHYFLDERQGMRVFNFEGLYEKYIKNPCQAYQGQMKELFDRANYDAKYHHDVNSDEPMFYRGWAYYTICTRAFENYWAKDDLKFYARQIALKEEEEDD